MDDGLRLQLEADELGALSDRAQANGRSLEQEAADIIRKTLSYGDRGQFYVEWAHRIRAMTPHGVVQTDSLQLLREDRDR